MKEPQLSKSMDLNPYPSIRNVWARDPENNFKTLIENGWAEKEFKALRNAHWVAFEKVDGTNVRVVWNGDQKFPALEFFGRKNKSALPAHLKERLAELFTPKKLFDTFGHKNVILYGEGYGKKIQKAGAEYGSVNFALFDIWFEQGADPDQNIGLWARHEVTQEIADSLRIKHVPLVTEGSLDEIIDFVRKGFDSQMKTKGWPEGVVARPRYPLYDQTGTRIICKVKHLDFRENRYEL